MNASGGRPRLFSWLRIPELFIFIHSIYGAAAQTRPPAATVEEFFTAVQMDNTNAAAALLESNTNLAFAADRFGKLPLLEAAAAGNAPLVQRLLQLGADINATGDTHMSCGSQLTALHEAIQQNRPEVCRVLLESGANPNVMAFGFTTPLHLAFSENREEMAGWLLDYGAEPFQGKLFSNDETTPFELAITKSDGRWVPCMLGQDAHHPLGAKSLQKPGRSAPSRPGLKTSAEILARQGVELVTVAVQRGELEAVMALFRAGVSIQDASPHCPTIFQAYSFAANDAARNYPALTNQWHRVQDQLIADSLSGTDSRFMATWRSQESSLSNRVAMTRPDRWRKIRDVLIDYGADYDAFAATALADTARANQLISRNRSVVQARDCRGEGPLHWAIRTDRPEMLTFWMAAGVPLNATNDAAQTALHLAASAGKTEFVKTLLAARASTSIRDTNGWTALDAAIQNQQSDCIHLLLPEHSPAEHPERGLTTPLHAAAAAGNIAALAALLDAETNLEARNELGLTPLQVAVTQGHLAAAALLVDKGANATARDPEGNSLLHQIFLQDRFTVHDRPPTSWLDHAPNKSQTPLFRTYLTVGQYQQGPNEFLQGTSFLLASGVAAHATNYAGFTVMQLLTQGKTSRGVYFSDNDLEKLLKLLGGAGGKIDERDADGKTALHHLANAVDANDVDRMQNLIAAGADVNATNNLGQTPLHTAAERIWGWSENDPPTEPFQLLIKSGANVNARDNQGRTPLDVLVAADTSFKSEATALLIKSGAKSNGTDKQGLTPVHLALTGKWPWRSADENLQLLANAGADFSARDGHGKTPLHYLAALGDQKPLFFIRGVDQLFINQKVDFNARDNEGNTPAITAAKTGTLDVFDWLLKQGADLDVANNQGETARLLIAHKKKLLPRPGPGSAETDIFEALHQGNIDAASRLLKADPAMVEQTNPFQETPLRAAVTQHQTNSVTFLESHGAKWDEGSAVIGGRTNVLRAILKQNPAAVASKVQGKGLLHIAAANSDLNMIEILIQANCDLQSRDNRGLSPLGYALIKKNLDVQELLLRHGARENFFDAVYANDLKSVAAQLAQDQSLAMATDSEKNSVTDIAVAAGYTDILKLLLKNRTKTNSPIQTDKLSPPHRSTFRNSGWNTAALAAFYNQPEALTLLLRSDAAVDQVDHRGVAPLHWAAIQGTTAVAELLLKHKADPNQATAQIPSIGALPVSSFNDGQTLGGETPLHLAALCGQTNMVQLLIKFGAQVNALNGRQQTPLDLASEMPQINTFGIMILQRRMWLLLEPLGVNPPPVNPIQSNRAGRNAAAELLKAAGGKRSQNNQPFGGR